MTLIKVAPYYIAEEHYVLQDPCEYGREGCLYIYIQVQISLVKLQRQLYSRALDVEVRST